MSETYCIPVRVYYEDTDAGGVVYYANYLRFMERARTEWLRSLGFELGGGRRDEEAPSDLDRAMPEQGDGQAQADSQRDAFKRLSFVVRSANIEYFAPARLNDELTVSVMPKALSGASLKVTQNVTVAFQGARKTLCQAEVRLACIDNNTFRPRRLPAALLQETKAWTT